MTIRITAGGSWLLALGIVLSVFFIGKTHTAEAALSITEKYKVQNGQWRTNDSLDDESGRLGRDRTDDEEEIEDDDDDDDRSSRSRSRRSGGSLRSKINRLGDDKETFIAVPVLGVPLYEVRDSWGEPRSGGRTHEGTDIFAPRGTYIVSPTDAVVTKTGWGTLGGNYVFTAAPGGETFYYAHLDKIAGGLEVGDVLKPGDLVGTVGSTGNAEGTIPHLHFTIYDGGAKNPFPRMKKEFTKQEQLYFALRVIRDMVERGEKDYDVLLAIHDMYKFF